MKALLVLIALFYVVSPIDAAPGVFIDDLAVIIVVGMIMLSHNNNEIE